MVREWVDGLRVTVGDRELRWGLVVNGLAAVAQGIFTVLFVVFVTRELGGDGADIGLLRGVQAIGGLPRVRVRIGVPGNPDLQAGARLLYGDWRDVGLGPLLVTEPARRLDGSFDRRLAAYPQAEALPAELVLRDDLGSRDLLLRALAANEQRVALAQFDENLRASARFVPVAWVVDARLVSPRLRGWNEDALGDVDYAAVRSLASSRRP